MEVPEAPCRRTTNELDAAREVAIASSQRASLFRLSRQRTTNPESSSGPVSLLSGTGHRSDCKGRGLICLFAHFTTVRG